MTSSTSCSSRGAALALAAARVALVAFRTPAQRMEGAAPGAAAAPPPASSPGAARAEPPSSSPAEAPRRGLALRLALLPVVNLSGQAAPLKELQDLLEAALRARGLAVASGGAVEEMLARHRLRYTGGVDQVMARAAREELGADALLVTTVTLHNREGSHGFGMAMRLASSQESPAILWMDETAGAVDDSPGLFDLGIVSGIPELMRRDVDRLVGSLTASLAGTGPAFGSCPSSGRFAPRVRYQRATSQGGRPLAVAVLPFVNETGRLDAGEVVALELVRELSRQPGLRLFEPGVVRSELLRNRVVMEGGVSHETARIALGAFDADVIVAGWVRTYDEYPIPRLEFTAVALDTRTNRVLWESTSYNRGEEGVWFFGAGRISTSLGLACRMARPVAEGMAAAWRARSSR
jgi:hypothetical protein